MAAHVRHSRREQVMFALRRPDILMRRLLGRDLIEISLSEIAKYVPPEPVILEAGACDGTDTVRFAQHWPKAIIHAFEPVPTLNREVERRTRGMPRVMLYEMALSGTSGTTVMHMADPGVGGNRGTSSLLVRTSQVADATQDVVVQTITLEDWAKEEGVASIDLMWLDMEGAELSALKSAGPLLQTVQAVCMEVSREERFVGTPLYGEVVSWMKEQGFRIAIDRVTLWFGNILFVRD